MGSSPTRGICGKFFFFACPIGRLWKVYVSIVGSSPTRGKLFFFPIGPVVLVSIVGLNLLLDSYLGEPMYYFHVFFLFQQQKLHHEMLTDRPRTEAYKSAIENSRAFIEGKVCLACSLITLGGSVLFYSHPNYCCLVGKEASDGSMAMTWC